MDKLAVIGGVLVFLLTFDILLSTYKASEMPFKLCKEWGGDLYEMNGRSVCLNISSLGYCMENGRIYTGRFIISREIVANFTGG